MKAKIRKIQFKLKPKKSSVEEAILLNEQYSSVMRQLYVLSRPSKQPQAKKRKLIVENLSKLTELMKKQSSLYRPFQNAELNALLEKQNIPNAYSLISLCEEKENNISYLNRITGEQSSEQKKNRLRNREDLQELEKALRLEKMKRIDTQNKIGKIKQQLEQESKLMLNNRIDNFDRQIAFRKLEKKSQEASGGEL